MGEGEGVGRRGANVSYQFKFWLSICQLSVKWLLLIKWRPKTSLTAVSFSPIFLSGRTQAAQWADKKLSYNVHFLGTGKQVRVRHASYLAPNWTSKIFLLYCLQTRLFILGIVWYKFFFSWFVFGIKCFGNVKTLTLYAIVLLFIQILTLAVYSSPSVFYWWKHSLPTHCFQNLAPLFHPNITDETVTEKCDSCAPVHFFFFCTSCRLHVFIGVLIGSWHGLCPLWLANKVIQGFH